jgi:hypothetical protein
LNAYLNIFKEKSIFGSNSIKECEHGNDKYGGSRVCKARMVSEKVKDSARGWALVA